jgi:hypothetical protein
MRRCIARSAEVLDSERKKYSGLPVEVSFRAREIYFHSAASGLRSGHTVDFDITAALTHPHGSASVSPRHRVAAALPGNVSVTRPGHPKC